MSIDPARLDLALQLFGVRAPDGNVEELAETLGVVEEILPWLVLRANALADYEDVDAALRSAAGRVSGAATSRIASPVASIARRRATSELDRALEELIKDNISRNGLATTADSYLADLVRISPLNDRSTPQHHVAVELP